MEIQDRIYGSQTITDSVLVALIKSKPLQRLKKLNQAGPSVFLYPHRTVTRFEHSVGVMLLLRRFGADLPTQIAGLLHDVPHTAFSHVADFAFPNAKHDFHERFHDEIIANSEIPRILRNHAVTTKSLHPDHFPLVDLPAPDLCADRLDYALRDGFVNHPDRNHLNKILAHLVIHQGEFMFNDESVALQFAVDYIHQDEASWASPREIALYMILGSAMAHAMENKLISQADLFTDDETFLRLLEKQTDPYIQKKLKYLNPHFQIKSATKDHHHLFVKSKVRFVDPKVILKGKVKRLSKISLHYKKLLTEHIQNSSQGTYVDIN